MKRTNLLHRGPDVGKLGEERRKAREGGVGVSSGLCSGLAARVKCPCRSIKCACAVQVRKYVSLRYLTLVKESKKAFRENNDRPRRPLPCRRRWVIFRGWHPSPECHSVSTCRALEAHLGMEVVCRKHGTTHRRNDAKLRYWGECLRHRCYLNRVDSCVIP